MLYYSLSLAKEHSEVRMDSVEILIVTGDQRMWDPWKIKEWSRKASLILLPTTVILLNLRYYGLA